MFCKWPEIKVHEEVNSEAVFLLPAGGSQNDHTGTTNNTHTP